MGAVLTGGASRRMGRTKATIDVGGVAMARRVADAMFDAGCSRVFAFGGRPMELASLGLDVVVDSRQGEGPFAAVLGILEAVVAAEAAPQGRTRWVLVAACDLPLLSGADLRPLIERAQHVDEMNPAMSGENGAGVQVVAARAARLEPACALWHVTSLAQVRAMYDQGERALHTAIEQLRSVEIDVDSGALTNINTPDDLPRYP